MDPLTIALIGAGASAAGSVAGGLLGRQKESKLDKQKRHLIDELLASVHGNGPFSNMFKANEEEFQKSYVNPAKSLFRNQIAPQIQQSYIQSGQQRGTGLEDTLSRAGVELDEMLNAQYLNYLNQNRQNQLGVINSILGGNLSTQNQSAGSAARQGLAGYISGESVGGDIERILRGFNRPIPSGTGTAARAGFETAVPR